MDLNAKHIRRIALRARFCHLTDVEFAEYLQIDHDLKTAVPLGTVGRSRVDDFIALPVAEAV